MDAAVKPLLEMSTRDGGAQAGVLVRVASLSGFGLRDDGDGAVVIDGVVNGQVLGGLCDEAIINAVTASSGRQVLQTRVTDAEADDVGMVCGGTAHLLLTPTTDLPEQSAAWLAEAMPLAIATPADGRGPDVAITRKDVAGEASESVVETARSALAAGATASSVVTIDGVDMLISTIVPSTRALIAGSGPMADAIAAQGQLMGWDCTISEDLDAGTSFLAVAGPADALIVLSHDRAVDVPLLDAALKSTIGYIGGMGSRGTQTARRNHLLELGHPSIDRIHGPIGLDLGSRNPSETAVAIVAEFLANRSGRAPGRLTDSAGPING